MEFLAIRIISSAFSKPNLPREAVQRSLERVDGRQAAIAFADGYFVRRVIEVVPNVSVKIFKYSGKSLEIKDFAVFFAPERLFTRENLLRDSDFSSEMWYNVGVSGS